MAAVADRQAVGLAHGIQPQQGGAGAQAQGAGQRGGGGHVLAADHAGAAAELLAAQVLGNRVRRPTL